MTDKILTGLTIFWMVAGCTLAPIFLLLNGVNHGD